MRFFLDCEWADTLGSELVSLGLVSEDDEHRYYAEVSPLPASPGDFVRAAVYPLLEGSPHARSELALTRDLRAFLAPFPNAEVVYDYPVDGALFLYALEGFEQPDSLLVALPAAPAVRTTLLAKSVEVNRQIERYFAGRPEQAKRRHHALVDAEALRWACCPPTRDAETLAARVPVGGGGAYVLQRDIPAADREAFWIFTKAQSVFQVGGGMAIPYSAWFEYLTWLREPDADPYTVSDSTKYAWRRRTGRWT